MRFGDRDSVWAQYHVIKLPFMPRQLVTYAYTAKIGLCRGWGLVDLFTYWANPMFKCEGF